MLGNKRKTTNPERRAPAALRMAALLFGVMALAACSSSRGTEPSAASGPVTTQLVVSPGAVLHRSCTPTGSETCFDARDDNCNGIIDEGCGVPTGLVQFVIAWNKPSADVDLDVTDPNGELAEVGRATESGLVKARDCPGANNQCHGQNLENVYLEESEALRGTYRARVRLESIGQEEPPIVVTLGARIGPKTYAAEFTLSAVEEARELAVGL